MQDFCKV